MTKGNLLLSQIDVVYLTDVYLIDLINMKERS